MDCRIVDQNATSRPGEQRRILSRIGEAARELNEQRERWSNPPEWIEPIARAVDAEDSSADVPPDARPLIRQSAIMARAALDARLKKRTLTNLYNARPTCLELAHLDLDRAVLAAYGWPEDWAESLQPKRDAAGKVNPILGTIDPASEAEALSKLLRLNRNEAAHEIEHESRPIVGTPR